MSKALDELREALYGTGLVQPVDAKGRGGYVSCLCRQLSGQEAPWIAVVDQLLAVAEEKSIDLHVCRRYVRREGRMVFGWFLGIETKNAASLVEAVGAVVGVLKTAKPSLATAAPAPARPYQSQYKTDEQAMNKVLTGRDLKQLTRAPPRPPNEAGPDPVSPQRAPPKLKTISSGFDEKGRPISVQEMQLPHTYNDLNVPKRIESGPLKFAGGAQATGGGG